MQLINRRLPDNHNLFLFSDLHKGSILFHRHGFEKFIDDVMSEKNNFVICGGDSIEAICVDDPRMDIDLLDPDAKKPLVQCKEVVKLYTPIKNRIISILEGNHEWKLQGYGSLVRDVICHDLFGDRKNDFYGTYSVKASIRDKKGNLQYKIFYTHGAGTINSTADDPIRRESNMKLSLKRKLQHKAGDALILAMGHTHKLLVAEPTHTLYLVDDGKKIKQEYTKPGNNGQYIPPEHRWYCNTGSFMKLYREGVSGYAERFGYDPVQLGYIKCEIKNRQVVNIKAVEL